jgi:hypothetical protein
LIAPLRLDELKRHSFDLISVTEPDLCDDDPSRKLMRQIMGAHVIALNAAHVADVDEPVEQRSRR